VHELAEASTLGDLLVRAANRAPDTTAIVFPTERVTYRQLLDGAAHVARGLLALGIGPGDHVGILMANSLDFLHTLFGASLVGAPVIPINSRFRTRELAYISVNADLKVIVTSDLVAEHADHPARLLATFPELAGATDPTDLHLDNCPVLRAVVSLGDTSKHPGFVDAERFAQLAESMPTGAVEQSRARVRIRDVAMILYTSGTTANPKGCIHTHEGLVRNGIVTGRTRFFLTSQDRFWDPLPMFHVAFLLPMIAVIDAGATLLTMSYLDGEVALEMMEREGATWLFPAFPAVANAFLDHPEFSRYDLSRVRMTMCVGPAPMLRRLQAALPAAVQISTYGSTETGGVITYHLPTDSAEQRATTCGPPFRGIELRISQPDTGARLPSGEIGEILVRGYSILEGYYKDPELTARTVDADGWLHTGDLGHLDDAGHVSYHGRLKDMFKVGGENVGAVEVEAVISEHPGVSVAQVVAAPDDRLDEVVAAFIELAPGVTVTDVEIIEFCRARIAGFKVPRYVRFVTQWPMSATKIQKHVLHAQICAELAPGHE
jgi:fatty-acyl-CoA synthase